MDDYSRLLVTSFKFARVKIVALNWQQARAFFLNVIALTAHDSLLLSQENNVTNYLSVLLHGARCNSLF